MEFFDKKQEVLEVKLTPYGRYKLSQGRLKATYYSFFDEGVLYDGQSSGEGKGGFIEKQNEIESNMENIGLVNQILSTINQLPPVLKQQIEDELLTKDVKVLTFPKVENDE